jgi:hypothetical protein
MKVVLGTVFIFGEAIFEVKSGLPLSSFAYQDQDETPSGPSSCTPKNQGIDQTSKSEMCSRGRFWDDLKK